MRARPLGLAAALVLVAAAAYSAYWFAAAAWMGGRIEAWAEARRGEGLDVRFGGPEVSGFPFRLDATITAPAIGAPPAWSWNADDLVIEARPWAFDRARVTLPAEQRLTYRARGADEQVLRATLERGVAVIELVDGAPAGLTLEMTGVVLTGPQGVVGLARVEARIDQASEATLGLSVEIENVTLPPRLAGGLGGEIALLAADAEIVGAVPRGAPATALAEWSAAGGTVEVKAFAVRWGALALDASGTLALDSELRPLAALSAEIEGYAEFLEALVEAGAIEERKAWLAVLTLNVLAARADDGTRVLKVPVTAQDGALFVGPLSLTRLGPVVPR